VEGGLQYNNTMHKKVTDWPARQGQRVLDIASSQAWRASPVSTGDLSDSWINSTARPSLSITTA
jgi:hypothetical protein